MKNSTPNPQIQPPARRISTRTLGAAFLALLVVVIVGGAVYFNSHPPTQPQAQGGSDFIRVQGPATAQVTIVEYGDFGCSTCRAWEAQGVIARIRTKYGDKVRFVWRDLPVITPQSPKAAEAAYCASDQGKFWQYHDLLYQKAPALSINQLKDYAVQLGLDSPKFNSCLDSGQHTADVTADLQDGLQRGFRATPAFLVNNVPRLGPQSFEELSQLIDSAN